MYEELVNRLNKRAVNLKEKFSRNAELLSELMQAANAIEELSKPHWIPVTERLPEDGVYVLGRYKNNEMAVVSVLDHDEDFTFWRAQTDEGWEADCDTEPTHWMPLPEPPKEEKQ